MSDGCLKYVTSSAGAAHDLGSGWFGAIVLVAIGAAGMLAVALATARLHGRRRAFLSIAVALTIGAAITVGSSMATTHAVCTTGGTRRFDVIDEGMGRAGLPAYFSERIVQGDSAARLRSSLAREVLDVFFWSGGIGLLLTSWTLRHRRWVPRRLA